MIDEIRDEKKQNSAAISPLKLRAKVEQIKNLPTLPQVINKLMSMMLDDQFSVKRIGDEISKDQSLTAKILKVVNSAYYGFHRQISTLSDAVIILGFDEIQRLTATISVFGVMKTHTIGYFSRKAFWEHSIAAATAADLIAKQTDNQASSAFVCGLLHDIGKVALDQFFHSEWKQTVTRAQKEEMWVGNSEKAEFGASHAEIGSWLTERWSLPPLIVEGIRYHHAEIAPEDPAPETPLWLMVQLADHVAREAGFGNGGDMQTPPMIPDVLERLGLSEEQMAGIKDDLGERMEKLLSDWFFLEEEDS